MTLSFANCRPQGPRCKDCGVPMGTYDKAGVIVPSRHTVTIPYGTTYAQNCGRCGHLNYHTVQAPVAIDP